MHRCQASFFFPLSGAPLSRASHWLKTSFSFKHQHVLFWQAELNGKQPLEWFQNSLCENEKKKEKRKEKLNCVSWQQKKNISALFAKSSSFCCVVFSGVNPTPSHLFFFRLWSCQLQRQKKIHCTSNVGWLQTFTSHNKIGIYVLH